MNAIAQSFVDARRSATPLSDFPGVLPADLAAAYAVQEAALALSGRLVGGWKVAMIHPELRERFGAERLCGPIFADAVVRLPQGGAATVQVYAGGFAALEAEFVAVIGRDLVPGAAPFTREEVAAAVASLHAGIEVASSPLKTINDLGPTSVVSDHGNNAGAIVGPELSGWREAAPERFSSAMEVNGVEVGQGSLARVPGGPLAALQFLANQLASRSRYLKAGDIVLTGMTTGIHDVVPGDRARARFAGVPDIEISVAARQG